MRSKHWQNPRKYRNRRVTWVQGHSRSSNLVSIERAYMTSYWFPIVRPIRTLATSRTLSELWWRISQKSTFGHTPVSFNVIARGRFLANMLMNLISPQVDLVGYIFVANYMPISILLRVVSCQNWQKPLKCEKDLLHKFKSSNLSQVERVYATFY